MNGEMNRYTVEEYIERMSNIKQEKQEIFCHDGYERLCSAVVYQAVKDYRLALIRLHRKPKDMPASYTVEECENFFRKDIGFYCDLDGEALIRQIRKKVDEELRTSAKRKVR